MGAAAFSHRATNLQNPSHSSPPCPAPSRIYLAHLLGNISLPLSQFSAAVRAGTKTQTIRANGKRRLPKVGEIAYCYTGLRTRDVCRLGEFEIVRVTQLSMSAANRAISVPDGSAWRQLEADEIEQLARADGFASSAEFFGFFLEEHGKTFSGYLVEWKQKEAHQ